MAQTLFGIPIPWCPAQNYELGVGTRQINAVGESGAALGFVYLSSGPGTSKVISAAGSGKIHFSPQAVTFADGATNFRAGIQDVDATTGIEDGTYDVHGNLTGGGGGIVTNTLCTITMDTGTKTIAHGDFIAVVLEMTARGGADSVTINTQTVGNLPYGTGDTGSGPAKTAGPPKLLIEFDDGTMGYFFPYNSCYTAVNTSFGSGSTPDEYALLFTPTAPVTICGLMGYIGELDSGETGNLKLYTDPTGTPTAVVTIAIDPDMILTTATAELVIAHMATGYTLSAGTTYAVAYEATSAGLRTIHRMTLPSANSRGAFPFGTSMQGGSRSDGSGAFGSLSTTTVPALGILISSMDDGTAGGGSGGGSFTFLG